MFDKGAAGVKKGLFGDFLIAGEIIIIGLAAAAHLSAIVLGWSFGRCALVFAGLVCAALAGGAGVLLFRWIHSGKRFLGERTGYLPCGIPAGQRAVCMRYLR